jgi:hypothetical protein
MMVFRYILMVNERFGSEELVGLLLRTVGEEGKEEMASVAEQLIEQGRQQGEQNGLLRGQRKVLVCLLRARFGELSESVVEHVNRADMAKLDLWTERVLSAPTLADVLGIS